MTPGLWFHGSHLGCLLPVPERIKTGPFPGCKWTQKGGDQKLKLLHLVRIHGQFHTLNWTRGMSVQRSSVFVTRAQSSTVRTGARLTVTCDDCNGFFEIQGNFLLGQVMLKWSTIPHNLPIMLSWHGAKPGPHPISSPRGMEIGTYCIFNLPSFEFQKYTKKDNNFKAGVQGVAIKTRNCHNKYVRFMKV